MRTLYAWILFVFVCVTLFGSFFLEIFFSAIVMFKPDVVYSLSYLKN